MQIRLQVKVGTSMTVATVTYALHFPLWRNIWEMGILSQASGFPNTGRYLWETKGLSSTCIGKTAGEEEANRSSRMWVWCKNVSLKCLHVSRAKDLSWEDLGPRFLDLHRVCPLLPWHWIQMMSVSWGLTSLVPLYACITLPTQQA